MSRASEPAGKRPIPFERTGDSAGVVRSERFAAGEARGDAAIDGGFEHDASGVAPPIAAAAHPRERDFLLSLNLPNRLTLARLVLAPVFGILLLTGSQAAHVAGLALYVLLALTDAYDGWLARRTGIVTSFGKFMDPLADKVLVSIALIVFVAKGLPGCPRTSCCS